MSEPPLFPSISRPRMTKEELVNYLIACKADGHEIYADGESKFVIRLGENEIRFKIYEGQCTVEAFGLGEVILRNHAANLAQLEQATILAARHCKYDWPSRPTTGRLKQELPASNLSTISSLIGTAKVEAVFDPYFENKSLITLANIISFGNSDLADGIRILGSTNKTGGTSPKFTKAGLDMWLQERKINGEARIASPNEHRRFLLLSSGESLILGPSLNAIHKNEACGLEPDNIDLQFFEETWATATPLT